MASAKTGGGVLPQSPASGDPGEKVNGDGDLDYTITMNESEDEASSDDASASEPGQKTNGRKPASPVKVNGKMTSDEESLNSFSKDVKDNEGDSAGELKGAEEKCGLKGQTQNSDSEDTKRQESETDAQDKSGDGTEKEERREETVKDKQEVDQEAAESETAEGDSGSLEEPKHGKKASSEGQNSVVDGEGKSKSTEERVTEVKKMDEDDDDDDDVVEIKESPMKQPVGGSSKGARDVPFVKVSNSNASYVPYLSNVPGSSLLTSTSGMQLVQVQGAGLVYVPSSSSVTSATAFSPSMSGINKGHPQSSPSLFMPQYSNMMTNQNRFMMSPYNQAVRNAVPSAPILTNIPEKPTSSIGMLENIRWEVDNHINIKPKYAKPNPKAELGHLTKWMFDLGSDLVKEFVYHDLVRIQHSRNSEGSLSAKEKDDFAKLQEIDKELNHKIGHLKIKLNKHCKCGFRTELSNVLYNHQQHGHIERGGFFSCVLCKFSTRQQSTFKFHMESIHGRPGYVENRPSFFECTLCPYETNYTNRLDQHKVRCQRQFREAFNLHPSCITGPEVNLCLENVFYYVFTRQFMNSIIPKPATPVVSSSTKIRDMPSNEMSAVNMQTRRGLPTTSSPAILPSAKQIVPKTPTQTFQTGPATMKQQPQPNSLNRNFPVMSSKMNTVGNQAASSTYTSGRPQVPPQNQPPAPNQPNNGFEVCEICGGYVKDRKALRIHFYYAHRIDMPFGVFERPLPPLYCATCFARFWTAQGLQKHIEVHKNDMLGTTQTSNGVAGKCISCGHRVPNILMHMRMVHNRELRHYLAALMCIFCGSRFSTKKEVETHMGKMHGVIVKNSSVQGGIDKPQMAAPSMANSSHQQPRASAPPQKTPPTDSGTPKPSSKGKNSRGSQCVLCNLSFSRNVDLTRHCMRVHHTCMKCGLVVVDKESLARHTCLHSASGMRTCQICNESGFHPAYYIKHMRDKHLRKCSVVLRHIDRAVVETMKRPITISDSEEEEPEEGPTEPKHPKTDGEETGQQEKAEDGDGTRREEMDQTSLEKDSVCEKETDSKTDEKEETGENDEKEETCENGKGEEENKKEEEDEGKEDNTDPPKDKDDDPPKDKDDDSAEAKEQAAGDCPSVADEKAVERADDSNGSDRPEEDSSDRKSCKRKMDEVENDVENDSPACKIQRRLSQKSDEEKP
ncbi:uncharacterized protein LOC143300640 [Babylonia areolata]|uniref:uncharacterized protein LOC143300640 n=1 Tax=Babylonia areolata TaxID=304850 RepID=UPI003FD2D230